MDEKLLKTIVNRLSLTVKEMVRQTAEINDLSHDIQATDARCFKDYREAIAAQKLTILAQARTIAEQDKRIKTLQTIVMTQGLADLDKTVK